MLQKSRQFNKNNVKKNLPTENMTSLIYITANDRAHLSQNKILLK